MKDGVSFTHGSSTIDAFGTLFPARNVVRNYANGTRRLHDPSEVRYTEPPSGRKEDAVPFMPDQFPPGEWEITGYIDHPDATKDPYLYPGFFTTNVKVRVPRWALDNRQGGYDHATEDTAWDSGHGLHCSNSGTSLGCINIGPKRVTEADTKPFREFAALIREKLKTGHVKLTVTGSAT